VDDWSGAPQDGQAGLPPTWLEQAPCAPIAPRPARRTMTAATNTPANDVAYLDTSSKPPAYPVTPSLALSKTR